MEVGGVGGWGSEKQEAARLRAVLAGKVMPRAEISSAAGTTGALLDRTLPVTRAHAVWPQL